MEMGDRQVYKHAWHGFLPRESWSVKLEAPEAASGTAPFHAMTATLFGGETSARRKDTIARSPKYGRNRNDRAENPWPAQQCAGNSSP